MRQNSDHAELRELAKKKDDEAKRMHYYKDTVLNQFKKHRDASKTVQKKNKNNIFKDRLKQSNLSQDNQIVKTGESFEQVPVG